MRKILLSIIFISIAATAIGKPISTIWNGSNLSMEFGNSDDIFRLSTSINGELLFHNQENIYGDGELLISNRGQSILASNIETASILLGGGNDVFIEPSFQVGKLLTIDGGNGNDSIKIPAGNATAIVKGGNGNDSINAEHNKTNFLYGENGNDVLFGSTDGFNHLSGGLGENILYGWPHLLQCDEACNQPTVFIHTLGAQDFWVDVGGNSHYIFSHSENPIAGNITIMERSGDDDKLYLGENNVTISPDGIISGEFINGEFYDINGRIDGFSGIEEIYGGNYNGTSVPEPTSYLIFMLGMVCIILKK